ncbi:MAG: peptide ABC transporter ATP-binding protein [Nitrospirae bacterium GWD2_57_9]|nr:MAG: peptide ABC transporter ATP-binding protein [Nitrospirae bacterium GWD2_57_9]
MDLLEIRDLTTHFFTRSGVVKAVDNLSLKLQKGRVLGLVGESGCGKTVTALSILNLVPYPGKIVSGSIFFEGQDLLRLPAEEMRRIRGARISMIFQEPMTALNPVFTVGNQIAEVLTAHLDVTPKEALDSAIGLLRSVGIPSPEKRVHEYPHQLSGGMRQRVMIAMAIACRPSLILADEPTTALDVTIQAHILELLGKIQEEMGMAMVLVTHDLGLIAERAHEVAVMYAGRIVEQTDTKELFANPLHPYTRGLIASVPRPGQVRARLRTIPGSVPRLQDLPAGCKFITRCDLKTGRCEREPELVEIKAGHHVRCWEAT